MTQIEEITEDFRREIRDMKKGLWGGSEITRLRSVGSDKRLVAEGDSWFDYKLGKDILDWLIDRHGYKIAKVVDGGDSLVNMTYGSDFDRSSWTPKRPQLEKTVKKVRRHQPRAVLFSGGGNDLSGGHDDRNLDMLLNHKSATSSSRPALRKGHLKNLMAYMRGQFAFFTDAITQVAPNTKVVAHGYGYVIPSGDRVVKSVGPWLRPAFTRNRYNQTEARKIMKEIIDVFNDMLRDLARNDSRFVYIDLRGVIGDHDWANELHPTRAMFGTIATKFHDVIRNL